MRVILLVLSACVMFYTSMLFAGVQPAQASTAVSVKIKSELLQQAHLIQPNNSAKAAEVYNEMLGDVRLQQLVNGSKPCSTCPNGTSGNIVKLPGGVRICFPC